jgi:hypothetical protein
MTSPTPAQESFLPDYYDSGLREEGIVQTR